MKLLGPVFSHLMRCVTLPSKRILRPNNFLDAAKIQCGGPRSKNDFEGYQLYFVALFYDLYHS